MLKNFCNEEFDIIIQAGQSNSEGCGLGPVDKPFEPNENIYMMENNFTIMTARENIRGNDVVGNFVFPFAENYVKGGHLKEGRKLLILLAAVGGTGFRDKRWGMQDDLYLRMIDMVNAAMGLNPKNSVKAFLWHQGESDALEPNQSRHYDNLKGLVASVRQLTGDIPFIAADFVQHWKKTHGLEKCDPIINAIRDVCNDIGRAGFMETTGLKSNDEEVGGGDDIHFSRKSLYIMGEEYFRIWEGIVVSS